jgi:AMMECR1 domain-containing protein
MAIPKPKYSKLKQTALQKAIANRRKPRISVKELRKVRIMCKIVMLGLEYIELNGTKVSVQHIDSDYILRASRKAFKKLK